MVTGAKFLCGLIPSSRQPGESVIRSHYPLTYSRRKETLFTSVSSSIVLCHTDCNCQTEENYTILREGLCNSSGNSAGNTTEENSSVFSLIRMR